MKKPGVIILVLSVIVGMQIAGCGPQGRKAEGEIGGENTIATPVETPLAGRILFGWTGFDEKKYGDKWGYCVYENGKIKKILPNTTHAAWVGKDIVLTTLPNADRESLHNTLRLVNIQTGEILREFKVPRGSVSSGLLQNNRKLLIKQMEKSDGIRTDNLALMDVNSGEIMKITDFQLGMPTTIGVFDISSDEKRVVFSYYLKNNSLESKIRIIDMNGEEFDEIPTQGAMDPAWSPDGKKIAFNVNFLDVTNNTYSGLELAVYNLETKEVKRLTHRKGIEGNPSFSPDGLQIVFVLWGATVEVNKIKYSANNLAVINIDGTGFRTLIDDPEMLKYQIHAPDWAA